MEVRLLTFRSRGLLMMTMLSEATPFAIFAALMLMLIAGAIVGLVSDAILRDTGFGVVVNGVLILTGSVLGICARLAL